MSKNYKDLLKQYGTTIELKQYLTAIYNFQKEANYERHVEPNSMMYSTSQTNNINEMLGKINEGKVDYKKTLDSLYVSTSEEKFKFGMGSTYTNQSFYEVPTYSTVTYSYKKVKNNDKDKKIIYNKESYLDRLYVWNSSKFNAYKNIMKDERYEELLQLQGKYFNLYMRIFSQPPNERDFDKVISNIKNAADLVHKNNYSTLIGVQTLLLPENKDEIATFLRDSAKECKKRANEIEFMMKSLE